MSSRGLSTVRFVSTVFAIGVVATLAHAGFVDRGPSVGGISINPEGIVSHAEVADRREFVTKRSELLGEVSSDLSAPSELRMVSLRKLDEAIAKHREAGDERLPEEIRYLAGLQRIEYVFVLPDEHDIVIAGPADGWKLDDWGAIVGKTNNQPVMELDDLLVALRTARTARTQGIYCSIDPTAEGLTQLRKLVGSLRTIGNPRQTISRIEQALGPQVITVGGVPESSRFARVLVAADFRMKRLAMHHEPSPVAGMPSYLEMVKAGKRGMQNMLPRWWLAPEADPLLRDADGLSWKIRNLRVVCKTEEDFVNADGTRRQSGKAGSVAQRWADMFTDKYDELAQRDSVFGQLNNLMQLSVAAALIDRENMFERAGFQPKHLLEGEELQELDAPRRVDSSATFFKKGNNWVISASGGVKIYPDRIAGATETGSGLAPLREQALAAKSAWWWD